MKNLMENLTAFLAKQLDKLKISNPVVFVIVQAVLIAISGLFATNAINIPTPEVLSGLFNFIGISDLDALIGGVLVAVIALTGARTTSFIK